MGPTQHACGKANRGGMGLEKQSEGVRRAGGLAGTVMTWHARARGMGRGVGVAARANAMCFVMIRCPYVVLKAWNANGMALHTQRLQVCKWQRQTAKASNFLLVACRRTPQMYFAAAAKWRRRVIGAAGRGGRRASAVGGAPRRPPRWLHGWGHAGGAGPPPPQRVRRWRPAERTCATGPHSGGPAVPQMRRGAAREGMTPSPTR
ncbi:MAG: hypothetical protein J3K34DRAFT_428095 [Monoraphidium minutum]|nr:MAG: hypothetical protein J3K34DRAFT_428095 [Monoraphidium minutum]